MYKWPYGTQRAKAHVQAFLTKQLLLSLASNAIHAMKTAVTYLSKAAVKLPTYKKYD